MNILVSALFLFACAIPTVPDYEGFPPELLYNGVYYTSTTTVSTGAFIQGYSFARGGRSIRWFRNERAAPNSTLIWHRATADYGTSYQISAMAHREGGDDIYVAGIADDGADILERWSFDPPDGRWRLRALETTAAIGVPLGHFTKTIEIAGGSFVTPDSGHVNPRRVELKRFTYGSHAHLGHLRSMIADPEGRYLLMLSHEPRKLYRLALRPSIGQPEVILDVSQLPHLANVRSLILHEHVNGTRVVILTEAWARLSTTGSYSVGLDANNDGNFDSWTTYSKEQWFVNPLSNVSSYVRLFSP